jgi:uncharacterized caspase-like protein
MLRTALSVVLLLCAALAPAQATAAERVALILGNSAYHNLAVLRTPVANAEGMAAVLDGLGFEVVKAADLDLAGLRSAIKDFAARAKGAKVALIYYSGHAVQAEGRNYMLGIDAKADADSDLDAAAVDLGSLLESLAGPKLLRIAFFDAGRDDAMRLIPGKKSKSMASGLAPLSPGNAVIGFAVGPGEGWVEGEGKLSPFAAALVAEMGEPGLEIAAMTRKVRDRVLSATDGRQIPWFAMSTTGEFYFVPSP